MKDIKTAEQILTSQRPIVLGYYTRINKIDTVEKIKFAQETIDTDTYITDAEKAYLSFFIRNRQAVLEF